MLDRQWISRELIIWFLQKTGAFFIEFLGFKYARMYTSIVTNRLLISHLTIDDHQFIFKLVNTQGWLDNIGDRNIRSRSQAISYTRKIIDGADTVYWVVRQASNGASMGIIAFVKRSFLVHHDIGFAFLPEYNRKGYAYEAARAVMQVELDSGRHLEIIGLTKPENMDAIRLLKKLGLRYEKDIRVQLELMQLYRYREDGSLSLQ